MLTSTISVDAKINVAVYINDQRGFQGQRCHSYIYTRSIPLLPAGRVATTSEVRLYLNSDCQGRVCAEATLRDVLRMQEREILN